MNDKESVVTELEAEKEIVTVPYIQEVEIDDDFVKKLEKNIGAYQKLIGIAIKLTNEQDWTNQQGKPYLDCSGAEKIANPFGVQIRNQRSQKLDFEDDAGRYYIWQYTAEFSSSKLGRSIEITGMCSSRDKFFGKESRYENGQKITILKPIEEIDQSMIMRKAQNNLIVNGIKRLIGLRNLTWEQIKGSGINVDKIVSVQYQNKPKTEPVVVGKTTEKKEGLFSK